MERQRKETSPKTVNDQSQNFTFESRFLLICAKELFGLSEVSDPGFTIELASLKHIPLYGVTGTHSLCKLTETNPSGVCVTTLRAWRFIRGMSFHTPADCRSINYSIPLRVSSLLCWLVSCVPVLCASGSPCGFFWGFQSRRRDTTLAEEF